MPRIFLSLCLTSLCFLLSAQSVQTRYFDKDRQPVERKRRAEFIVETEKQHDSLYQVREYHRSGQLLMSGSYASLDPPVEHGEFAFYRNYGSGTISTGQYTMGRMSGIWSYYWNNQVYKTADYDAPIRWYNHDAKADTSELPGFFLDKDSENDFWIAESGEIIHPPQYPDDGLRGFYRYLGRNFVYPTMPRRYAMEDTVMVNFLVDATGKIHIISADTSVHKDFRQEAIRVVASSPEWIPAKKDDQPANIRLSIPVYFRLRSP